MVALLNIIKSLILISTLIYTTLCFVILRCKEDFKKESLYFNQRICIFVFHFLCTFSLYLVLEDYKYLCLYLVEIVIFIAYIILFERVYPDANKLIINNMCMLLIIGLTIIARLSFEKSKRQFLIMTASFVATFFLPHLVRKIKHFAKYKWVFASIGIFTLLFVLVFSNTTNGSKLNVMIANYTFQPSEFVKIIFVLSLATILFKNPTIKSVSISCIIAGLHVLILVLSKDLGSAIIYFVVYFSILFVATGDYRLYLCGFLGMILFSIVGYFIFSHVRVRVEAFLDPFKTIETSGYQIAQSLFAIGSGGLFGRGLGRGMPKNIPVVVSDFVFSAICEEFGVIFGICLILICISNIFLFINISLQFKDVFYKLTSFGLAISYGFQIFLSIGGVTKFIPLTGVTLPFISYGGTSVLVTIIVFSIIQGLYIDREMIKRIQKELV